MPQLNYIDLYAILAYIHCITNEVKPMQPFDHEDGSTPERNSERMNFRTKPRIKEAIQRAAALSGLDDSAFTMNAAYKAALETISSHEQTHLQVEDHQAFFDALEAPAEPSDALQTAFDRYKNRSTPK
ncbi:MAG: DUF1778 domain-containing protein [Maricaulis sp.]|nr:DUF1778 domain-containing protein [Maricaulis sp.]MDG2043587.1 DUF1778 domain-containing protein [Maricaulis sp.]